MANFYKLVRRTFYACFFLTLFILSAQQSYAQLNGSYTIDKSQPASSTNFISFQSFFTQASSVGVNGAVTVTVLNGPYTEQVTANTISGVSAAKNITINGNNQVLQFSATSSSAMYTLQFNGTDYVTLKNLYIKTLGTSYAWGIHITNSADYITVDGCTIECNNSSITSSVSSWGIVISSSTTSTTTISTAALYTKLVNNTIKSNGPSYGFYGGISTSPQNQGISSYSLIKSNVIQDFYSMGIQLYYASGVNVISNDISRPTRTSSTTVYGIRFYYYSYNDTIMGNKVHNLFTNYSSYTGTCYGLYCYYQYSGSSNCLVANNAVYNIEHNGALYGLYCYYSQGTVYAHNTISNDLAATNSSTTYGVYYYDGNQNLAGSIFANNVVSLTRPGGTRIGIYYYSQIANMDNNFYYVSGTGSTNYMAYIASSGAYYTDFPTWQSGTGKDAKGGWANPKFVNVTAGDLTPTLIQFDGQGQLISSVKTDINGNARSTTDADPGSFNVDVNANVTRLALATPNNCQFQKETVKVWVKNSSPFPQSGFNIGYRINNGAETSVPFTGTLNAGDSAQFTFPTQVSYNTPGSFKYEARIVGKPWVGPYTVNINAAPVGSEFTKGTNFQGTFNSGNVADPDITANPDQLNYELTVPTGYFNTDYGTKWYISKITAKTIGGATINSADTAFLKPAGSQNLKFRFKPSGSLTDSVVKFVFQVYSNTTSCFAPDIERVVFVAPRPKAGTVIVDVCDGDETVIASASTISTGTMNYSWDLGDGTKSTRAEFPKKYPTYGTYNVKLVVTSNYGYTDSVTKTINVYQKPVLSFTHTNQCAGSAVPFTNTSTVPNGSPSYTWKFGDGKTSTVASPSYTYTNTGLYTVTLEIVDGKGCFSTLSKPVTYSAMPVADFSAPTTICNQKSMTFTNASTAAGNTGYSWDFGDGNMLTAENPDHTYANAGSYNVVLTAQNEFGCKNSKTRTIVLKESPTINYTISSQCVGDAVTFTNTTVEPAGTKVNYTWDFGDATTSTNKNETHTYQSVGNYKVVLMAFSDNLCNSVKEATVTFTERPVVDFSLPQTACVGQTVNFTNNSKATGVLTYDWDLGDGGTSTATDPTRTYTAAGALTVKLKASSSQGCSETVSKNITISAVPNSGFTFQSAQTGNGGITFTPAAPNGTGTYVWTYGDGSQSNSKGQHNYRYLSGVGLFKVTLAVTENNCSSSTTKDIIVNSMAISNAEGGLGMQVYPNPSTGKFTVSFAAPVAANATVKIINLAGQAVKELSAGEIVNGQLNVDVTGVSAGVYFIQVTGDGSVSTQKINIVR